MWFKNLSARNKCQQNAGSGLLKSRPLLFRLYIATASRAHAMKAMVVKFVAAAGAAFKQAIAGASI